VKATFNETEQEVIALNAVWNLIDEMVNWNIFVKTDVVKDVTLIPSTGTHQQLFNILLLDFLTVMDAGAFDLPRPANGSSEADKSYLFYLNRIAASPQLNPLSGHLISTPTKLFTNWLETECTVEGVWLPTIEVQATLTLKRISFIKICGNIAKHSFAGLSRNSKDIAGILSANGVEIEDDQRFLVIPDFYEWFHRNILSYHLGAIAEFLNNIRAGIYDYLLPEWNRAYKQDKDDPTKYSYLVPDTCNRPLSRNMYWDLMNEVRAGLYMPRFEVTPYLKMRY
jgi:hypothetical protein